MSSIALSNKKGFFYLSFLLCLSLIVVLLTSVMKTIDLKAELSAAKLKCFSKDEFGNLKFSDGFLLVMQNENEVIYQYKDLFKCGFTKNKESSKWIYQKIADKF